MAQDWYYQLLGEETGPISFESLQDLVREGHLNAEDQVRSSASAWMRAAEVPDLFAADATPEPENASDLDLDLLLSTSSTSPMWRSSKRRKLEEAKAAAARDVDEWYYQLLGQEVGPSSLNDIVEQIQLGSLQSDDLVRQGAQGEWHPLDRFSQFSDMLSQMQPKPEWYCRILGQVLGPMVFDELQHMAESNSLNTDDEVRLGETGAWQPAVQTRGLKFPVATKSPAKAPSAVSTHAPFGEAAKKKEWYYEILGQEFGPISFLELARAVTEGTLQLEDKARRGKTAVWGLVLNIPELISVDQKAAYLSKRQAASRPKPAASPVAPTANSASAPVPSTAQTGSTQSAIAPPAKPVSPPTISTSTPSTAGGAVAAPAPAPPPKPAAPHVPPSPPPTPVSAAFSGGGMASQGARPSLPPSFKKSPKTKEPIRLPINGKIVGAILGVLLLAGVAYGLFMMGSGFFVQAGLPEYERVKPIWTDAQNLRRKDASSEDWALFQKRHEGEIKKLLTEIEDQSPGSGKRLLQLMYFCVKDHLPKIMVNGDKERMKAMDTDMKEAAKLAAPPP